MERKEKIFIALGVFSRLHGRFPCPSDDFSNTHSVRRGRARPYCADEPLACKGFVPFRTLGLPEETALDSHNKPFVYAVHPFFTTAAAKLTSPDGSDLEKTALEDLEIEWKGGEKSPEALFVQMHLDRLPGPKRSVVPPGENIPVALLGSVSPLPLGSFNFFFRIQVRLKESVDDGSFWEYKWRRIRTDYFPLKYVWAVDRNKFYQHYFFMKKRPSKPESPVIIPYPVATQTTP